MAATYYRPLYGLRVQQSEATAARRTFCVEFPAYWTGTGAETITITVSKAGGAFAATAGTTLTALDGATYKLVLAAADLDTLGDLCIKAVGMVDTTFYTGIQVQTDDPYAAAATAAAVADAVWEELVADHKAIAGSYAKWLNDIRQATPFGKSDADTSANTIDIHDTDGTTHLVTATLTTVGTVTTSTPSPLT